MKRIVFLDRDGTLIVEPPDQQIDTLEKLQFLPGAITGLKLLANAGYSLIMVSNQDGLGTKAYPQKAYDTVQQKIIQLFEGEGITFERVFICPHKPEDDCSCRKPKTGLVDAYLKKNKIDREHSFVIGDRVTDVQFARNLRFRAIRLAKNYDDHPAGLDPPELTTPDLLEACSYAARSARSAEFERNTAETEAMASVALEGLGKYIIRTGIPFFNHMLAQLSRHSRIDMAIRVNGDLEVDEHHTVEDCGIVLGNAIREALGKKRGINRFGFAAPLDEALAQVSIDLSGRRHLTFQCDFKREYLGELPTELIEDFFRAFADGLNATLHISCRGRNDHHKAEAIFKAVALALRDAVKIDQRTATLLPTTKGKL